MLWRNSIVKLFLHVFKKAQRLEAWCLSAWKKEKQTGSENSGGNRRITRTQTPKPLVSTWEVATGLLSVKPVLISREKKTDTSRDWDQLSTNVWVRDIKRGWDHEGANLPVCLSSCLTAVTMTTGWTQEGGAWDSPRIPRSVFLPSFFLRCLPPLPLDPPSPSSSPSASPKISLIPAYLNIFFSPVGPNSLFFALLLFIKSFTIQYIKQSNSPISLAHPPWFFFFLNLLFILSLHFIFWITSCLQFHVLKDTTVLFMKWVSC